MAKFLDRLAKIPLSTLVIVAVVLFAGSGYYWWTDVYTNPQNVFDGMLNNSLRLKGVTRTVSESNNQQGLEQISRLNFTAEPAVLASTTLTQGSNTTVKTESIGTPTEDYVKYNSIKTDQPSADGSELDFSQVLNIWGRSGESTNADLTDGELYNELTLGIVTFGNLSADNRHELLELIEKEKVYEVDYRQVTKFTENGRPLYAFEVGVDAEAYVKLIQRYGELTGLNNLQDLDPEAYAGSERLKFTLTVDVRSRQLVKVENLESSRTESFSGHNAALAVGTPDDSIPVEELQQKLQEIQ